MTTLAATNGGTMMALRRLHPYLVALGGLGITTLFLPFTGDYSPLSVILGAAPGYELLAGPFFLAIPITLASAIRLWTGRLWRLVWLSAYGLALAMVGMTLSFVSLFFSIILSEKNSLTDWSFEESLALLLGFILLLLGTGRVIRNWRRGLSHALNAVIAMQVAYVANGVLCLVMFFEEDFFTTGWEIGAYVTLVTVIVYLAHIVLLSSIRFAAAAR